MLPLTNEAGEGEDEQTWFHLHGKGGQSGDFPPGLRTAVLAIPGLSSKKCLHSCLFPRQKIEELARRVAEERGRREEEARRLEAEQEREKEEQALRLAEEERERLEREEVERVQKQVWTLPSTGPVLR